MGDLTPKAHRLTRLYQIMCYLNSKHADIPTIAHKNLIENGRVAVDIDDDDGTISLLNFILSEPDSRYWIPCVEQVVSEYKQHMKAAPEKSKREHSTATQRLA